MRIEITNGEIYVEKLGNLELLYCPYAYDSLKCGVWCPMCDAYEVKDDCDDTKSFFEIVFCKSSIRTNDYEIKEDNK